MNSVGITQGLDKAVVPGGKTSIFGRPIRPEAPEKKDGA
jgi:hypothetical protein